MRDIVLAWRRNRRAAGRRLRRIREEAGLTQLDLAARTGLSDDTICRIELGYRAPQEGTIQRLALGLEAPPDAFVEGIPAPNAIPPQLRLGISLPGGTTVPEEGSSR